MIRNECILLIDYYKDSNSEKEQCINKLKDILGNYQNYVYQTNGLSIKRQTVPQIQLYVHTTNTYLWLIAASKLKALYHSYNLLNENI